MPRITLRIILSGAEQRNPGCHPATTFAKLIGCYL